VKQAIIFVLFAPFKVSDAEMLSQITGYSSPRLSPIQNLSQLL
jgi:hypothetical protein